MQFIKQALILDTASKWHGKRADVVIQSGKIAEIGSRLTQGKSDVIKGKSLILSPAWLDIGTALNEPGYEQRETLAELVKSARFGGYGGIAPFSTCTPAIDSKSSVSFLIKEGLSRGLNIHPIANLSAGGKGKDLSDLYDLHRAGAVAYSDGLDTPMDLGLLLRALQYVKPFEGKIIVSPGQSEIISHGLIHEGKISTELGMRGIPTFNETAFVDQAAGVLEYADSSLILFGLSAKETCQRLNQYQKTGLDIQAVVPYLNLIHTVDELTTFDSRLKVLPPLRATEDRKALVKAINNGDILAIASNHRPLEPEVKDLEFEYAEFGASGIETVFSALNTFAKGLKTEALIYALSEGPMKLLNIPHHPIEAGNKCRMTLVDTEEEWHFDRSNSPALNQPFLGKKLVGRVLGLLQ